MSSCLQRLDRREVLLDRHLLEQDLEPGLDAGLDAHVDEEQAGLAHLAEQLRLDVFGAAADLPDRALGEPAVVHPAGQLVRPAAPLLAPEREIVVLEQEDAHAVTAMQVEHLLDHLVGLAHAHDLAGRRAVEGVDRAERAAADAAAARQQRQRREPADLLRRLAGDPETAANRDPARAARGSRRDDLAAVQIGDALDVAPVLAGAKPLDEFDQRLLALVAHDAVDLGKFGSSSS